jgi:hypothetical protein
VVKSEDWSGGSGVRLGMVGSWKNSTIAPVRNPNLPVRPRDAF